jgi:hypothetical protein
MNNKRRRTLFDNWKVAILKIFRALDVLANTQSINGEIESGTFMTLTEDHLRKTVYGGRPAYQHQVVISQT